MKYTSEQVLSMSWQEWNETMAKELNEAGFLGPGFNHEKRRFDHHIAPYKADGPVEDFILGKVTACKEITHLKNISLLNNGRCPMCGGKITGTPRQFTSGFNPNTNFHICKSCCSGGRRASINPANKSGCMLALLLLPFNLIKAVFEMIG